MKNIERVQYQATLAITGAWKGTSRLKVYAQLGIESLSDRRSLNRVLHVFKIKNNLTPPYLRAKLPPLDVLLNETTNTFQEIATRTIKYKNSFFPNAITTWNNTTVNLQGNHTKSRIKAHILRQIRPQPKSVYGIHDPSGLRYLFQLRTRLSPLRSHKYHHNFRDTPNDICSCQRDIEDVKHFLFECLQFANARVALAVKVTNILLRNNLVHLANNVDIYLYGHPSLSAVDNKEVLSSTIHYLKNTQRFNN